MASGGPLASMVSARGWGWSIGIALILLLGGTSELYPGMRAWCVFIAAVMMVFLVRAGRFGLRDMGAPALFWSLAAGLVVLQAIPLPAGWSASLPGREWLQQLDAAVFGGPIARPLSLDPDDTPRTLFFLFPPLIAYLAMRFGDAGRRAAIIRGILLAMAIGFVIQLVQVTTDGIFVFREGRDDYGAGFFSNHNHMAAMMLVAGSVACAFLLSARSGSFAGRGNRLLMAFIVACIAIIGALLTSSRAALVLIAIFALLGAGAFALDRFGASLRTGVAVGAGLLVSAVAAGLLITSLVGGNDGGEQRNVTAGALAGATQRASLATDARYEIWDVSAEMAKTYFPAGAGFGSFRELYERHEPLEMVGPLYSNHAHNDYLELAIEGGLPAIALLVAFLLWFANALRRALADGESWLVTGLFAMPVVLLCAHSFVDYPTRTIAVASILAAALGLLTASARPASDESA
ncbi:O-antigen ligase family protein [Paraurantiacibacter namhicola]|uniref:O-Antigen ligase n=1 Tax=Paraurantiacibacter namhicola TaxID=645517 RepID=A0A1C7D6P9_9SPHN|nr:O-antigen ligase family protein [Paraurantiacibacter namhicola]ANU07140.1 O-Antigen ligase [Paraurantiacibacter namhicola]